MDNTFQISKTKSSVNHQQMTLPLPLKKESRISLKWDQFLNQFHRSFIIKIRDTVNLWVTLVFAPVLSVFTAWLFRVGQNGFYSFSQNSEYPKFLFIIVLVAIFFGITNSVTEIIKDRLLLKKESLFDLSILAYFFI